MPEFIPISGLNACTSPKSDDLFPLVQVNDDGSKQNKISTHDHLRTSLLGDPASPFANGIANTSLLSITQPVLSGNTTIYESKQLLVSDFIRSSPIQDALASTTRGDWELLESGVQANTAMWTVPLNSYDNKHLKILLSAIRTSFDGDFSIQLSTDGTTYKTAGYSVVDTSANVSSNQTSIVVAPQWSYTDPKWHGTVEVDLFNRLDATGLPKIDFRATWWKENVGLQVRHGSGAYETAVGAIQGIQFFFSAGNISSAKYAIWGSNAN